jgi:hypothetical protein
MKTLTLKFESALNYLINSGFKLKTLEYNSGSVFCVVTTHQLTIRKWILEQVGHKPPKNQPYTLPRKRAVVTEAINLVNEILKSQLTSQLVSKYK